MATKVTRLVDATVRGLVEQSGYADSLVSHMVTTRADDWEKTTILSIEIFLLPGQPFEPTRKPNRKAKRKA